MTLPPDRLQHTLNVFKDFRIPESHDREPVSLQAEIPHFIVAAIVGMLTSIKFNDELGDEGHKIDNVLFNGLLPAKLDPSDLTVAQISPE